MPFYIKKSITLGRKETKLIATLEIKPNEEILLSATEDSFGSCKSLYFIALGDQIGEVREYKEQNTFRNTRRELISTHPVVSDYFQPIPSGCLLRILPIPVDIAIVGENSKSL